MPETAVRMASKDLAPLISDELAIAAINGPQLCVASGTYEAIAALSRTLAQRQVQCVLLRTSHAFHSPMMEPMVSAFEAEVSKVKLLPPRLPIMSTATAQWLTAEAATDPAYWARQLRMPVRFSDAMTAVWKHEDFMAVELGPGATASTLARRVTADRERQMAVPSLSDSVEKELPGFLAAVGRLWAHGANVELGAVIAKAQPVSLPGYPFARDRHWIEPVTSVRSDNDGIAELLQAQLEVLRRQAELLERRLGSGSAPVQAKE